MKKRGGPLSPLHTGIYATGTMATEQEIQTAVSNALRERDEKKSDAEFRGLVVLGGLLTTLVCPPVGIAAVAAALAGPMMKGTKEGLRIRRENPDASPKELKQLIREELRKNQ